jgi:hypothetical protein
MDDYVSESDSDYTSYWRDWVRFFSLTICYLLSPFMLLSFSHGLHLIFTHGRVAVLNQLPIARVSTNGKRDMTSKN